MSEIIIPRKHLRQPQGRIRLKDEWADAQFVTAADTISNAPRTVSAGFRSLSFHVNAATGGRIALPVDGAQLDCAPGATLVVLASLASAAPQSYLYALVTGFTIDLRADSINLGTSGTVGLYLTNFPKEQTCRVYTKAPENYVGAPIEQFTKGVQQTLTPSQNPSGVLTNTGVLAVGNAQALNRQWAGEIQLVAATPRKIDSDVAADISRMPWQLFRADPIRIYSFPTGAISINSITASNITQTGARITLGLTR